MATSAALIQSAADPDLRQRLIALAAASGIRSAQTAIESAMGAIVATPIVEGQCIADVYAYRVAQEQRYRPGEDPAAVTDAQLTAAIQAVLT